jgi:hypothetical protein
LASVLDEAKSADGGTEWFLNSVVFLDEIAQTLELDIQEVIDVGDVE